MIIAKPYGYVPFDCAIAGGGLAGLAAALALGAAGRSVALVAPSTAADFEDRRTTALFPGSVLMLDRLGVWAECEPHAAPLRSIRLIDGMGRLLRAPDLTFKAEEIGLAALAYNIENIRLGAALSKCLGRWPITRLASSVATVAVQEDAVVLTLESGETVAARLVVGADGKKSLCRRAAGIEARAWTYDQTAVTCNFIHSRDHQDTSTEFHRPAGPCTTVPLGPKASSLVWLERPAEAARLMHLDDVGFTGALEDRLQGLLGAVRSLGKRAAFPISGLSVDRYAARRIALVGEAAHAFPPIGAQGLNLSFRDVAALEETISLACAADPGGEEVQTRYDRSRHKDARNRTLAVDLLNRSLLTSLWPLQLARGFGLHALRALRPMRREIMRRGLAPASELPRLMRPDALPPDASLRGV